ncbi:uncharacterized protein LOC142563377 [Dermacentor variabilis]|uniref:uncharacterized protein LOC142563377 n=1 Tax=Dermacentor variabilis TaxID=34621 RepID=UPI003F5C1252
MTQRDLEVLCGALAQMSAEELLSLKEADIWWLPDLTDVTQMQAIHSIRLALEGLYTEETRTFLVAWLYCCLAERQLLRSWCSYRATGAPTPAAALTARFILHERLATALKYPGCHIKCAKTESAGVVYACVMATRPGDALLQHDVICLCAPRSLPCLLVHVTTRCELRLAAALHVALQKKPEEILEGHFDKLGLAFASSRQPRADVRGLFMSNAPDKTGSLLKTCDRKDQTVAHQPGQRFAEATILDDITAAWLLTPPPDDFANDEDNTPFLTGNIVGVGPPSTR